MGKEGCFRIDGFTTVCSTEGRKSSSYTSPPRYLSSRFFRAFRVAIGLVIASAWLPVTVRGAGGGADPPCFQHRGQIGWPGAVVRGVIAVQVSNYVGFFADVDATLRLQRNGRQDTFRIHVPDVLIESSAYIFCAILDALPLNVEGQTIQEAFAVSSTRIPFINARSIRRESVSIIPGTDGILSALADVTIHYVEAER